jgi:hypothetical protein
MSLAEIAQTRQEYIAMLQEVVRTSLDRAESLGSEIATLTLHIPKEMGDEEERAVKAAAESYVRRHVLQVSVVKVTEEQSFFAVDERYPDGVPRRGTVIQVSDRDYMLYTEGRDEKEAFRGRVPTALRVTPQGGALASKKTLLQVNDLSQVNWRGFNARSQPISVYYGNLIAQILSHVAPDRVSKLYNDRAKSVLEERMWFL